MCERPSEADGTMATIGGHEVVQIVNPAGSQTRQGGIFNAPPDFPRTRATIASSPVGHRSKQRHSRIEAKQEQVLHEVFSNSRQQLVRIAFRILRNHEDAEDAVQNAFLSA